METYGWKADDDGDDYDDDIFIKLPPHANQLAQDRPPLKPLVREKDIGEKTKQI